MIQTILSFLLINFSHGKMCPSNLMNDDDISSPVKISEYLKLNNIKSVKDFVCCLPKEFQKDYIVGMSSVAAQNGTPISPRIIMSNVSKSQDDNKQPALIVSFNGGKSHSTQGKSIEIAIRNNKTKELELLDIDFSNDSPHLSINPKTCMHCHGSNAKIPAGGPRYIFDSFPFWARFVGGLPGGIETCNQTEIEIHNKLADKAIETIKKEDQYSCLDKSVLETNEKETIPQERYPKLANNILEFDFSNLPQEHFRASRFIASLPEYNKFKYFLFGFKHCDKSKFEEWLPESEIINLFAKIKLHETFKKKGDLKSQFNNGVRQVKNEFEVGKEIQKEKLLNIEMLYETGHTPNYSPFACRNRLEESNAWKVKYNEIDFKNRNPKLLLELDTFLRGIYGAESPPNAAMRLFVEGNGHPLAVLSTALGDETPRFSRGGASVLLGLESDDSDLKKLFQLTIKDKKPIPNLILKTNFSDVSGSVTVQEFNGESFDSYESLENKTVTCETLKKMSLAQFKNNSKLEKMKSSTPVRK